MTRSVSASHQMSFNKLGDKHLDLYSEFFWANFELHTALQPAGLSPGRYIGISEDAEMEEEMWGYNIPPLAGDGLGEPVIPLGVWKEFHLTCRIENGWAKQLQPSHGRKGVNYSVVLFKGPQTNTKK